jgi:hypothetical protein
MEGVQMSDTPRTDEFDGEYSEWSPAKPQNWPAFARTLERELNAANSKIELLMSANADVARIADERDAAEQRIHLLISERDTARRYADQKWKLRQEFHDLFGNDDIAEAVALVRGMKDRIKRLEEAGGVIKASLKRSLNPNEQGECKWLAELPMTDAEFAVFTTAFEAKEAKL